jgi:hypothetical protein
MPCGRRASVAPLLPPTLRQSASSIEGRSCSQIARAMSGMSQFRMVGSKMSDAAHCRRPTSSCVILRVFRLSSSAISNARFLHPHHIQGSELVTSPQLLRFVGGSSHTTSTSHSRRTRGQKLDRQHRAASTIYHASAALARACCEAHARSDSALRLHFVVVCGSYSRATGGAVLFTHIRHDLRCRCRDNTESAHRRSSLECEWKDVLAETFAVHAVCSMQTRMKANRNQGGKLKKSRDREKERDGDSVPHCGPHGAHPPADSGRWDVVYPSARSPSTRLRTSRPRLRPQLSERPRRESDGARHAEAYARGFVVRRRGVLLVLVRAPSFCQVGTSARVAEQLVHTTWALCVGVTAFDSLGGAGREASSVGGASRVAESGSQLGREVPHLSAACAWSTLLNAPPPASRNMPCAGTLRWSGAETLRVLRLLLACAVASRGVPACGMSARTSVRCS